MNLVADRLLPLLPSVVGYAEYLTDSCIVGRMSDVRAVCRACLASMVYTQHHHKDRRAVHSPTVGDVLQATNNKRSTYFLSTQQDFKLRLLLLT
jgi:hypothetical protein